MRRGALLALVAALAVAVPAAAAPIRPSVAFTQLLDAARAGKSATVFAGLSVATRAHYLTPSAFAKSPAGVALTAAAKAPHIRLVDQTFPDGGAAEAVKTTSGGYAGALRLEPGRWRLVVDPNVLIQPLSPQPGAVSGKVFQVASQAMLPDPVDTGALYLDGKPLSTKGGATNGGRTVTLYANIPQGVAKGRHTLVAYARGGAHSGALAWAFTIR
ncbi:MAG: hypothetical protein ACXVZ2_09590 [Gaiellaceae bacterium]